ncbi:protein charybde-like isoform X1 [Zootermopsis nevadensis]|uniref:Protein charybde n=1 Tax=Zootermopsis nevadensis TaxID=136037 RepID=A0A067R397_ZOONE|nr:protein charybde-like isoform X1 [Zootermopsis nevadensis]KDR16565.1 Protein charybde [Zootermopsis nevadensis]
MMKGEIEHFLEDSSHRDTRLHGVFNKISDIWQHQNCVSRQKMTSDVIESILPERFNVPVAVRGYRDYGPDDCEEEDGACQALAQRLEDELRAAKSAQLACGEVLLPADLLPHIARDVLRMAENEPCGLRGCTLFINFENDHVCRRIGTIKCDPSTVSTFELFLTLKQDSSSWHSLLPQFLKNLTRGGTIMISQGFTLEKKKLYRSYLE